MNPFFLVVNIPSLIKAMPYNYNELELPEWFNYELIHDLERLALPEFFKGDSPELTPDNYILYRDYMMKTYKANPDYYLTISACKSKLDVDLVTLVRVHGFLESYNLINSRVSERGSACKFGLNDSINHYFILLARPS